MRAIKKIVAVTVVVLLLAGCATGYQPFQVLGTGGYKDERISEDTYHVAYYANHLTSQEALRAMLFYRSAELTLSNGYDWFEVLPDRKGLPWILGGFAGTGHVIRMHKGAPTKSDESAFLANETIVRYRGVVNKLGKAG
jgi:hypothetical protein